MAFRSIPSALRPIPAAVLVAFAGAALAQPRAQAPSVAYVGPASCPSEAEFVVRLRARLGSSETTDARSTLDVRIAQEGRQYVGRLSLIDREGRSTTKELRGHGCDELVDALALVAALAVRTEGPAATAEERPPPPPVAVAEPPRAEPRPAERRAPAASRFGVAAGGLVTTGVSPTVLLGGTLSIDWAWKPASAFGPALGLGVIAAAAPDVTRPGGRASFTFVAARVDACIARFALGAVLAVRGCLLADAGVVHARGSDTVAPGSSSREWLSLGASSQFEVPLTARLAIRLTAGVEAPLRRDRYAFGDADFFVVPPVIATGSLLVAGYVWP
jgi:hypothetical protein